MLTPSLFGIDEFTGRKSDGSNFLQGGILFNALIIWTVLILFTCSVQAAEITVVLDTADTDCSNGFCNFQSALDLAASNDEPDVINIPSTWTLAGGALTTSTPFLYTTDKNYPLEINGVAEESVTILSGDNISQVLRIENTGNQSDSAHITLRNLLIHSGHSNDGAGLYVSTGSANLTIEGCTFNENTASASGGGAWLEGYGVATISDSDFSNNRADNGAGLYMGFGAITMTSNNFKLNTLTGFSNSRGGGAYVSGYGYGPLIIKGNQFDYNQCLPSIESCQGGGLYLSGGGFEDATVEKNLFRWNQLGPIGSGAGAYIQRVDGPINIQGNTFTENIIGGIDKSTGGGGLWLNLYGSFSEGAVINNAFVGNASPFFAKAAGFFSEMAAVTFGSNTVYYNRPIGNRSNTSAVSIDAPGANIYNNIFWNNAYSDYPGYDLYVADQSYTTEDINLIDNNWQSFMVVPTDITGVTSGNTSHLPFLMPYPDYHIASALSPMIDSANTYPDSLETDIDGDPRLLDGDMNGFVAMDKGADEFYPSFGFLDGDEKLVAIFNVDTTAIRHDGSVYDLYNTSNASFEIEAIYLDGSETPEDWSISFDLSVGDSMDSGEKRQVGILRFLPSTKRNSSNTLVVETSQGTLSFDISGLTKVTPAFDTDGVGTWEENRNSTDQYDGNCDFVPDCVQNNVATFQTRTGHWLTLVAPTIDQRIGEGDAFPADQIPFLSDVMAVESSEEGGGPMDGALHPYGFFRFSVFTLSSIIGGAGVGDRFPVSIILPEDGPPVNSYSKNGPTPPEEDWLEPQFRPEGGVGEFNFKQGHTSHYLLVAGDVGYNAEEVTGLFPTWDSEVEGYVCAEQTRTVIHLRLIDGELGDYDLVANGIVIEPGGPAFFEVEDVDGDGIPDEEDNCPDTANPDQTDSDGDGIGDACEMEDLDGDGISDDEDNCPLTSNPDQTDSDADGSGDACDGCQVDPLKTDPGICGCSVADTDSDSDGTPDCNDNCPDDPAKVEPGACGCGVADVDTDGDGTMDCIDGCPADPLKIDPGVCGCGVADMDSDSDGTPDCNDNCPDTYNPDQVDSDGNGIGDECDTAIDITPPEISIMVSPDILWPPNHKMVSITVTLSVSDDVDPNPVVKLISITMNEGGETNSFDPDYDQATGAGNTSNDIQVINGEILLRAERSGTGDGRVYTLTYRATDSSGNQATASATVIVPHDME